MYVYIYIYMYTCTSLSLSIHIYIYICIGEGWDGQPDSQADVGRGDDTVGNPHRA